LTPLSTGGNGGDPRRRLHGGRRDGQLHGEVSRDIPLTGYESAKAVAEKLGGRGNVVLLHSDLCPVTGSGRLSYERAECPFKQNSLNVSKGWTLHQPAGPPLSPRPA
jgi:hypothetical protein